jgi:hypothetical protein
MSTKDVMTSQCDAFNRRHPVGSEVCYVDDLGKQHETTVKAPAKILGGHTPVAWLEGVRGAYLLSRVIG